MNEKSYTISGVRAGLADGSLSIPAIAEHYRKRAKADELNAFLSVFDADERELSAGLLTGVPCAIKDNMLVEGSVCTAGSKILKEYLSAYDATAVAKLKQSGAVILGKTNMDEFAMGSSTENSAFGRVKNPLDHTRVPGGSSGGSAAAVAADLCVFALGSDTGGSIRQPASLCGIVGLKPTYGRVSRHGLMALASSLDQIGPLTKDVTDAALVMGIIAGHDPLDATTAAVDVPDYTEHLEAGIEGLRVGVPKEYFGEGLDAEVAGQVRGTIASLVDAGAQVVDISLPHSEYALAAYYIVLPCEVSANLSRYDGIRFGHSSRRHETLLDVYRHSRAEGFGPESTRRIMLGTFALSAGYFDAYYLKAQKVRALIRRDFDRAFEHVDVIVGPTSPTVAFKAGQKADDPLAMYLSDIYTVPVNLAGVPALSVPCGNGAASGLPVGFQIIGNMFQESTILRVGRAVERALTHTP